MMDECNAQSTRNETYSIHFKTFIPIKTVEFDWEIENLSRILPNQEIKGPEFAVSDLTGYIKFKKFTYVDRDYGSISFYLIVGNTTDKKIFVTSEVSILDDENAVIYSQKNCIISTIASKGELSIYICSSNSPCHKVLVCDDKLILKGTLKLHHKTHAVAIAQEKETPPVCNLEDLSMDLKLMLNSSVLADINLLVGSDVVRAHKFILSARSPVFTKMLKSGMMEEQQSVIQIVDLDLPVLKSLINFLYTGVFDKNFDDVCSLYYAAHKYQVSSLEKTCRQHLLSNMEISNACQLLMLADRHSDQVFKSSVIDFIKFNYDKFKISVVGEDLEQIRKLIPGL